MKNFLRIGLIVMLLAFLTACGDVATGFRVGLKASKPFVTSLVTANKITQAQADLVNADIDDSVKVIGNTQTCLGPATDRLAKAKCYFAGAQELRSILSRHNFEVNESLNSIAVIAQGAIDAFEEYARSVNSETPTDGPTRRRAVIAGKGNPDTRLENKLKELNKQLKELQH